MRNEAQWALPSPTFQPAISIGSDMKSLLRFQPIAISQAPAPTIATHPSVVRQFSFHTAIRPILLQYYFNLILKPWDFRHTYLIFSPEKQEEKTGKTIATQITLPPVANSISPLLTTNLKSNSCDSFQSICQNQNWNWRDFG